jgi:AFG3 family protein
MLLIQVTKMATTYVTSWGMSKVVGPIFYESSPDEIQKPFSDQTAKIIVYPSRT